MHGLVALDASGSPLTPLITWADTRAAAQARALTQRRDGLDIYHRTGTPLHPMSQLAKLMWFREHDRSTFDRTVKWVSLKELILRELVDELVVDHSSASATGLFNLQRLDWDEDVLDMLQLSRDKLSAHVPTTEVVGRLGRDRARGLALPIGTPVVAGASDGALANLGVGAVLRGMVGCTIGTSGAVRMCVAEPLTDARGRTFCYALTPDRWVIGGATSNGGIALRWLRDRVLPTSDTAGAPERDRYRQMSEMAGRVAAGSDGLLFLPHLLGERAPQWHANARAAFIGLTIQHGREHLVRSVMEGVTLQLWRVLTTLAEIGGEPREIRATGGFARSRLWRQIVADVFGAGVSFPREPESACLGAAVLAMKAVGSISSLAAVEDMVVIDHRHDPFPEDRAVYRELGEIFTTLYDQLSDDFDRLARLQGARDPR